MSQASYVRCPICGEPDMPATLDDGVAIITCTNHACASNGGSNASALKCTKTSKMSDADLIALAAAAQIEAVIMAGDNQVRALNQEYPMWASGHGMMPAGVALFDELTKRGHKI